MPFYPSHAFLTPLPQVFCTPIRSEQESAILRSYNIRTSYLMSTPAEISRNGAVEQSHGEASNALLPPTLASPSQVTPAATPDAPNSVPAATQAASSSGSGLQLTPMHQSATLPPLSSLPRPPDPPFFPFLLPSSSLTSIPLFNRSPPPSIDAYVFDAIENSFGVAVATQAHNAAIQFAWTGDITGDAHGLTEATGALLRVIQGLPSPCPHTLGLAELLSLFGDAAVRTISRRNLAIRRINTTHLRARIVRFEHSVVCAVHRSFQDELERSATLYLARARDIFAVALGEGRDQAFYRWRLSCTSELLGDLMFERKAWDTAVTEYAYSLRFRHANYKDQVFNKMTVAMKQRDQQ